MYIYYYSFSTQLFGSSQWGSAEEGRWEMNNDEDNKEEKKNPFWFDGTNCMLKDATQIMLEFKKGNLLAISRMINHIQRENEKYK